MSAEKDEEGEQIAYGPQHDDAGQRKQVQRADDSLQRLQAIGRRSLAPVQTVGGVVVKLSDDNAHVHIRSWADVGQTRGRRRLPRLNAGDNQHSTGRRQTIGLLLHCGGNDACVRPSRGPVSVSDFLRLVRFHVAMSPPTGSIRFRRRRIDVLSKMQQFDQLIMAHGRGRHGTVAVVTCGRVDGHIRLIWLPFACGSNVLST